MNPDFRSTFLRLQTLTTSVSLFLCAFAFLAAPLRCDAEPRNRQTPTPTPRPGPGWLPAPVGTPNPAGTPSPAGTPVPDGTPAPITVAAVSLPELVIQMSVTDFTAPVVSTGILSTDDLVGFQGDFTFDSSVITFGNPPVSKGGLTGGAWNVSGNVMPGSGPIRTLRIAAFSVDFSPLSGEGTLFNLNMTRASSVSGASTPLIWADSPDNFFFIDGSNNLEIRPPGNAPPGSIVIQ